MLCMHELAFTRSEPEAKMNAIHCKPKALEVQYRSARGWVLELFKKKGHSLKNSPAFKCLAHVPTLVSWWRGAGAAAEQAEGHCLLTTSPCFPQPHWAEFDMRRSAVFLLVGFRKSNITWQKKSNDFTLGVKRNNSGKDSSTYCQRKLHTIYYFDILECVRHIIRIWRS